MAGCVVKSESDDGDDGDDHPCGDVGAAWRRDCGVAPGDSVQVVLSPEGPQREDLADDIWAALDAEPVAGRFFDGLAQFYRQAYLRWIDATKRRPDERARRIVEMVELLLKEKKERPKVAVATPGTDDVQSD